jgi:hypothetical protein
MSTANRKHCIWDVALTVNKHQSSYAYLNTYNQSLKNIPRLIMSNIVLQRTRRSLQPQHKSPRHHISTRRARMRVIMRVVRIHSRRARLLIQARRVDAMVDIRRTSGSSSVFGIGGKARRRPGVDSAFPDIVGCLRGEDDVGTFGFEQFGCVEFVCVECLDGLGDTAVRC